MYYLVTIFETEPSKENPSKPVQLMVHQNQISEFVINYVDGAHYCVVGSVPSYQPLATSDFEPCATND